MLAASTYKMSTLTLIFNSHFSPGLQITLVTAQEHPDQDAHITSHSNPFFYHTLLHNKLFPPEPLTSISGNTILTAAVPL